MHTRHCLVAVLFTAGLVAAQGAAPVVEVTGAVKNALKLSADDLARMPRTSIHTKSKGVETVYEGVLLHQILQKAGAPQGEELHGKTLASYVLAEAQDGYEVLFSLAELDPEFLDSGVLLADTANGKPLAGAQGRFLLVAPNDKHPPRSVRMLTRLEVVQLRK